MSDIPSIGRPSTELTDALRRVGISYKRYISLPPHQKERILRDAGLLTTPAGKVTGPVGPPPPLGPGFARAPIGERFLPGGEPVLSRQQAELLEPVSPPTLAEAQARPAQIAPTAPMATAAEGLIPQEITAEPFSQEEFIAGAEPVEGVQERFMPGAPQQGGADTTGLGLLAFGTGLGQMEAGAAAPSKLEALGGLTTTIGGMMKLAGVGGQWGLGLALLGTLTNMAGKRETARIVSKQRRTFAVSFGKALAGIRSIRG